MLPQKYRIKHLKLQTDESVRKRSQVSGLVHQLLRRLDGSIQFPFVGKNCNHFFEIENTDVMANPECLLRLVHPDDRNRLQQIITTAEPTAPWQWEGRYILPSGAIKLVQCDAYPHQQTHEGCLWSCLLIDITKQQQLSAEVQQLSFLLGLTERLQSSTDLHEIAQFALEYFVQATQCAFGDVKVIDNFIGQTPQALPIVNYVSGEFVATYGQPVTRELEAVLKKGQPYGQGLLWKVVETGKPIFVEDYANHPDAVAELRHPGIGRIGVFPIPATDGTIIGGLTLESRTLNQMQNLPQQELILAACRILGIRIEQARAQDQLRHQKQQLEQALIELQQTQLQLIQTEKMSSLGQLVAGVAHEINNPVSFIYGNLTYADQYIQDLLRALHLYQQAYPDPAPAIQTMLKDIDLGFINQDLPKLLHSMQVGAERIRDIVLSLRNFSRLDEAEMKAVDIHEGINNTLMILENRLRPQINRAAIQVIKQYGELPLVECHAGQLNQVFMNILVNAIDALDEKLGTSTCSPLELKIVTALRSPNQVEICIADNGNGIPPALETRLFDPFFTTKPIGKGTGMGLSISYQIITKKHHGTIQCSSTPGQGATFIIKIPVTHSAP